MNPNIIRAVAELADAYGVNLKGYPLETLVKGTMVELEHGTLDPRTNVTSGNIELSFKIALAHLSEFPDYYASLERMENRMKKRWKGVRKPRLFTKKL